MKRTEKIKKRTIIMIFLVGLPSLLAAMMAGLLFIPFIKMGLHLDFSQAYRHVESADRIRFWDSWSGKVYIRYPLGLRSIEKQEEVPEQKKPVLFWLETDVYDVAASGDLAAWYDREENKIFLGSVDGEVWEAFDAAYEGKELAFSPDGRYLLVYEIEYGVYGGYSTDEECCYYRVIDLESGAWYPVYSGYREWFRVYWEEE